MPKHEIRSWTYDEGDDTPLMAEQPNFLSAWNSFVSAQRMGVTGIAFTVDGKITSIEEIWHRAGRPNRDGLNVKIN